VNNASCEGKNEHVKSEKYMEIETRNHKTQNLNPIKKV
jgi:hypothetical protein